MLRHLLTAPVNATDFLIGKCLSVFAVTALGFVIFILIGIAGGVHWGPLPAVVTLMLASSLATAGMLLFIMSCVGSERQGDTLLLARAFLERFASQLKRPVRGFTPQAIEAVEAAVERFAVALSLAPEGARW